MGVSTRGAPGKGVLLRRAGRGWFDGLSPHVAEAVGARVGREAERAPEVGVGRVYGARAHRSKGVRLVAWTRGRLRGK